ncbi:MAG: RluA family pseudouridine synthase [Patescibacteria group bacterium]
MDIIFENSDVCVINKPGAMSAHQDGFREEYTVSDWFVEHVPSAKDVGEPLVLKDGTSVPRHGVVHRLDKETSGVMILAKTQEAFLFLKTQFQDREVEKVYRAFLWGEIKVDGGVIDKPIGRSRGDFRTRSAEFGAKPPLREATTNFTVLARGGGFTYVEARPETGRMHQLRVHFKAHGNPIVCDKLYMPRRDCALGFSRLALHALSLSLTLPTGEKHTVEAPLPEDFRQAEEEIRKNIA